MAGLKFGISLDESNWIIGDLQVTTSGIYVFSEEGGLSETLVFSLSVGGETRDCL